MAQVHIIGGGLAGSEAAWQLANRGVTVRIYEMRPVVKTAVHKTENLAELVCSNSFRGGDPTKNAVAILHEELRSLGSIVMRAGEAARLPAGGAFAVDREIFAEQVTAALEAHPNIEIVREEISELPKDGLVIVATGPLTSSKLAEHIQTLTGSNRLSFYDAVAPIISFDSIDMDKAWFQSRYDKGLGKDYINCPLSKEQYYALIDGLNKAEQAIGHNPEDANVPYFEACLPIEVMAERGVETLRWGPFKPRGLTNAHQPDIKPYAVVQLRRDNKLGTLYNMVGFQTRMKWGAQKEIIQSIPGLEKADIVRFGVIHKNTFINSPELLDERLRLKAQPHIRFAGQVSGVEGYVESTAMGMLAGLFVADEVLGTTTPTPPDTTMLGGLVRHITGGAEAKSFQPMNINFGLLPPLEEKTKKLDRKAVYCERARTAFSQWLTASNFKRLEPVQITELQAS